MCSSAPPRSTELVKRRTDTRFGIARYPTSARMCAWTSGSAATGRRGGAVARKHGVGIGIGRMVAVHARGPPAGAVEAPARYERAGIEEEHELAVAPVGEEDPEPLELRVAEDAAVRKLLEMSRDPLAGAVAREPEPRHRGVVDREVVARHRQPEPLDVAEDVDRAPDRRHPVVRHDRHRGLAVDGPGRPVDGPEGVGVPGEPGGHPRVVVDVAVEVGVELAQIEEEEGRRAARDVPARLVDDQGVGEPVVGVGPPGDAGLGELVEDRRHPDHAARLVEVPPLRPVEPGQEPRPHRALEERTQAEQPAAGFLQEAAPEPVVQHDVGEPAEVSEPAERRSLGIAVEEVPSAVALREEAGEDRGDRARAVAEHGPHRLADGEEVGQELPSRERRPAEPVHEDDDVHGAAGSHGRLSTGRAGALPGRARSRTHRGAPRPRARRPRSAYGTGWPRRSRRSVDARVDR